MKAAEHAGCVERTHERIRELFARESFGERFVTKVIGRARSRPDQNVNWSWSRKTRAWRQPISVFAASQAASSCARRLGPNRS